MNSFYILIIEFIIGLILFAIFYHLISNKSKDLKELKKLDNELKTSVKKLENNQLELTNSISILSAKKEEILSNISSLQKQAENSAKALYEKSYDLANEKMDQAAKEMSNKYKELEEIAKLEYQNILKDCVYNIEQEINNKKENLLKIQLELSDLTEKVNIAVKANKRAEEQKRQKDFYRLQLSQIDLEEIKHLRSIGVYLRNDEPLNKVIWKVYYEKPYTDLIGRVVGTNVKIGIYKITNIENQMCYVGQSTDIANRFKQHIKRGIGAEAPTRNKLYPAMLEFGVENFTFEIIEECDKTKLNEREQYWQEYFHAKDFGYSIK